MKKNVMIIVILLGIALPSLLFDRSESEINDQSVTETQGVTFPTTFLIRVKDGQQVVSMDLEEYILCVVMGEMPADFEIEALKAQAVATRTYTLRKILKQDKHDNADVCTDASCCQAFENKENYLFTKGTEEDIARIESAVQATKSEVLTYNGELIEATYFSCSGGMTEDAVAVWGTKIPYLESVVSPGENQSKHFETEKILDLHDFLSSLGLAASSGLQDGDIAFTYTAGNGVETMTLLGTTFTGTEVRRLLQLPSTSFSLTIDGNQVYINSRGYGHRVGMSQYGADVMAVNGSSYEEVLLHYYQGTVLIHLTDNQLKGLFDKEGNI